MLKQLRLFFKGPQGTAESKMPGPERVCLYQVAFNSREMSPSRMILEVVTRAQVQTLFNLDIELRVHGEPNLYADRTVIVSLYAHRSTP